MQEKLSSVHELMSKNKSELYIPECRLDPVGKDNIPSFVIAVANTGVFWACGESEILWNAHKSAHTCMLNKDRRQRECV